MGINAEEAGLVRFVGFVGNLNGFGQVERVCFGGWLGWNFFGMGV